MATITIAVIGLRSSRMTRITYEIVEHDGGWAYRLDGAYSETFPNHDAAFAAAKRAAIEQRGRDRRRHRL